MFPPIGSHDQVAVMIVSFTMSTLLKNESMNEESSFPVSTSLKNESVSSRIVPFTVSTSFKK